MEWLPRGIHLGNAAGMHLPACFLSLDSPQTLCLPGSGISAPLWVCKDRDCHLLSPWSWHGDSRSAMTGMKG